MKVTNDFKIKVETLYEKSVSLHSDLQEFFNQKNEKEAITKYLNQTLFIKLGMCCDTYCELLMELETIKD